MKQFSRASVPLKIHPETTLNGALLLPISSDLTLAAAVGTFLYKVNETK